MGVVLTKDPVVEGEVIVDGATVRYYDSIETRGSRNPIVLIHGTTGSTAVHFEFLYPMLATRQRVVSIDAQLQRPVAAQDRQLPPSTGGGEHDGHQDGQDDADEGDGLVLAGQVGRRALLDGRRDFLHAGVARVLGKNPAPGPDAVHHGQKPTHKRQNERRIACHR